MFITVGSMFVLFGVEQLTTRSATIRGLPKPTALQFQHFIASAFGYELLNSAYFCFTKLTSLLCS
jgi:hypothetical protein